MENPKEKPKEVPQEPAADGTFIWVNIVQKV